MGLKIDRKEDLRVEFYDIKDFLLHKYDTVHLETWLKQASTAVMILLDKGLIDKFYLEYLLKFGGYIRSNFSKRSICVWIT